MSYPYTQANRLEEPHSYMYTPFQGSELLQSYQSGRMAVVRCRASAEYDRAEPDHLFVVCALPALEKLLDTSVPGAGQRFRALLAGGSAKALHSDKADDGSLNGLAKNLENLTTAVPVITLELLHALIAVQLTSERNVGTKIWLDRLVQRFEVTKKLYASYPAGFRNGEGGNTSVRLYWLFALALSLFYARTNEIKYLSTLLKVCDLLCSLPENRVQVCIPENGLSVVLAAEVVSVQLLAEKKGVPFAPE